jgi:1-acyl-sn-glycerol-3-phosphate acyltransferase
MLDAARALARLLGPRPDPGTPHELDPPLVAASVAAVQALNRVYCCAVIGLERVPPGAALLVGNHNAGISFLDPFFFGAAWHERTAGSDPLHWLAHDAMLRLPVIGNLLLRVGGIRASHDTAMQALARGRKVVVYPGGNREAFRPWSERHRVDFGGHRGFARLALRAGVPIVPLLAHGSHGSFVVLTRGEKLAAWTGVRRHLRSPSFPIFLGLPWGVGVGPIFHLPLPVPSRVVIGEPLPLAAAGPPVAEDPAAVQQLYDRVVGRLQEMMDREVARDRRTPSG